MRKEWSTWRLRDGDGGGESYVGEKRSGKGGREREESRW